MKSHTLGDLLQRASQPLRIVGLMSGTSVDGIDAALVEVGPSGSGYDWHLLGFECVPWEPELRTAIQSVFGGTVSLALLTALNSRIGEAFADAACRVVTQAGWGMDAVDAIASHGQTVWHQPEPFPAGGGEATGTLQLGDGHVIATRTGCVVVSDFRLADMALGGQGAPLVPFVDYALFSHPSETRLVLNLGGIANGTYLPAGGGRESLIAFDTGPGNMILDALMTRITDGVQTFDREGAFATRGTVSRSLLLRLLEQPYFRLPPPKSTGREQFGTVFANRLYAMGKEAELADTDILATATALTAETVGEAVRKWLLPYGLVQTVILGGGGTENHTLIEMLRQQLSPARLTNHAEFGLPDDAKEAAAFAFLAYETLNGRPANVPAATGARGGAILGKISLPPPAR